MAKFDKLLELRNIADGAETVDAQEAGVALDVRHMGTFDVVFYITAIEAGDANETYVLNISTDSVPAFSDTPVIVGSVNIPRATAVPVEVRVPLSSALIRFLDPDAAAIRVGLDSGGTTPSITYGAYISNPIENEAQVADLA